MQPAIRDRQLCLVNCWIYLFREPAIGDIAVFRHPQNPEKLICKRISEIRNNRYILRGDNPNDSLDSRDFGEIPRESILGRVFWPRTR